MNLIGKRLLSCVESRITILPAEGSLPSAHGIRPHNSDTFGAAFAPGIAPHLHSEICGFATRCEWQERNRRVEGVRLFSPPVDPEFWPTLDPDPFADQQLLQEAATAPEFPRNTFERQPTFDVTQIARSIFGTKLTQSAFYPVFTQIARRTEQKSAWGIARKAVTVIGDHHDGKRSKLPLLWNLCSYRADARNIGESEFTYKQEFVSTFTASLCTSATAAKT